MLRASSIFICTNVMTWSEGGGRMGSGPQQPVSPRRSDHCRRHSRSTSRTWSRPETNSGQPFKRLAGFLMPAKAAASSASRRSRAVSSSGPRTRCRLTRPLGARTMSDRTCRSEGLRLNASLTAAPPRLCQRRIFHHWRQLKAPTTDAIAASRSFFELG